MNAPHIEKPDADDAKHDILEPIRSRHCPRFTTTFARDAV